MRKFIPSFFFVFSLLFTGNALAEEKSAAPKQQKAVVQKIDVTGKIRTYLDNNCFVALKTYIIDPSDKSVSADGEASGFLVAVQGTSYIFTNAHVIRNTTDVQALFDHDISPQALRYVGNDDAIDVAIFAFADKKFRAPCALPLGDSDTLLIGDEVFTLASHPFVSFAFSKGYVMEPSTLVISLKDALTGIGSIRLSAIYSEINLNPGSSGSPLFNVRGEVIGMNQGAAYQHLISPASLSIPINLIKKGLPEILKGGSVPHGFINIVTIDSARFTPLDKDARGINTRSRIGPIVMHVPIFSSAERAGIEKNDMIVSINGIPTPTANDLFTTMIFTLQPNTVAKVTLLRDETVNGKTEQVSKTLNVPVEELRIKFQ